MTRARSLRSRHGFTLIELILVMAILAAVLAVSAPSLGRFFRGRNLDAEAYRLLALTRHAQDRSVSEGIPMILWIDLNQRRYGLQADPAWSIAASGARAGSLQTMNLGTTTAIRDTLRNDPRAVEFAIADEVEFVVQAAVLQPSRGSLDIEERPVATRPLLRFQPDGFLPVTGPEWIVVQSRETTDSGASPSRLWIAPGENRMAYEIWTNQPPVSLQ